MNVIILCRLLKAAWVKPKVQTNRVNSFSSISCGRINESRKNDVLLSNCASSTASELYCRNCRKYKNFGHERPPPPSKLLVSFRVYWFLVPVFIFFNWKMYFYYYKPEWYAYWRKYDAKGQDINVYKQDLEIPFTRDPWE